MRPPVILTPGKLNKINKYVLEKTGCFAFLVPDKSWNYSDPGTGKGAVELWSVALYTIYHDYGCGYLNFILDSANEPNDEIEDLLFRSRRHKKNIERTLRPNVAHGGLDSYTPNEIKRIYFAREDQSIDQLPDSKWFILAEKIRRESDDLVNAIYKWADGFEDSGRNIRDEFGSSNYFKKSIDARVMFDTLDNDFWRGDRRRARNILESISKRTPNEKLDLWRDEVSSSYLNKELETPKDIIYQLKQYLYDVHHPEQPSSVTIGDSLGFSLSSLL